ncbi:hypothetical protein ACP275_14G094500 [Erythranthe tilingii]
MKVFELHELEATTESFSPSRLIGKGSHGSVYRGVLKDGTQIAVKKQSLALQKLQDDTKLENEASILSSLSPDTHPCIVDFLGCTSGGPHPTEKVTAIVTEYMPNGTLHEILHPSTLPMNPASPRQQQQQLLLWRTRLEIAVQVACGVRFLHESDPTIVHRDIKSANILLDGNWNAKLADFGLATRLHSTSAIADVATYKIPAGTIGYIDPSYTTPSELSTKIDVFSYGVVLLELISGRRAIDMDESPASIIDWALPMIERGRAADICDGKIDWPRNLVGGRIEELLQVAARCLSVEQNNRPPMDEIVGILEDLIVEPIVRVPLSMNYVYDMILSMMRRRKFRLFGSGTKLCGEIVEVKRKCASDDDDDSVNMCKGSLLVREILADITLK